MSAILAFLGGSAFRMIWGEVSSYFSKRQDHKLEIERIKLQGELDAKQHERNQVAIRTQHELGIQTIRVQADADTARTDAEAFAAAMQRAAQPSGIKWVDAWNASVRPAYATFALGLWVLSEHRSGWALTAWTLELIASVAGFYFADRTLGKRGK